MTTNGQTRFGRASGSVTPQPAEPRRDVPTRPVPQSAAEALRPQAGVEPPKRMRARAARNQFVIFFNLAFTLLVLVLIGLGSALYVGRIAFENPGPLEASSTFVVRPGSSVSQIASSLERRGMISNARVFEYGARAYSNQDKFKAGEYEVRENASMKEIMETMVRGISILYPLTIVEGMTVQQAWQKIAENETLDGEMPAQLPPEGWLVADTQKFSRGTTRADIVERMIEQQRTLVQQIWERRAPDLPIATVEEFVTLASIVEKETGVAEERPRVAAVFINRLRQGIRLQSDPTIIYGVWGGAGKPADEPIRQSHIRGETPYNTYTIDGLPPTPIAIPGRASLEAVANPAQTDDLFFVADGTGGHAFAKTLDEHNANVARWREIERKRAEEAGASTGESNGTAPAAPSAQ